MTALDLADPESLADLQRYLTLARRLDDDAAVRLLAVGEVLAAYVCVLPGRGLSGTGTVLGLRTVALARPASLDATVPVAAVLDRLARGGGAPPGTPALQVPPMASFVAWSAISPPRAGWQSAGELTSEAVTDAAREGIHALGQAGTAMAATLDAARSRVWTAPIPGHEVPAGLAFGAYALRFLTPRRPATLWRAGSWTRLSTPAGHVLAR